MAGDLCDVLVAGCGATVLASKWVVCCLRVFARPSALRHARQAERDVEEGVGCVRDVVRAIPGRLARSARSGSLVGLAG
eukprot:6505303-Alexandrium_andersonii.AAC.1